ncbi:YbgA family protein [Pseudomonas sp. Q1-7]|uniref:YbgA family protein n=1 Tax=Pseudomonas sp. Q1-7 TaxID=3020843 RepID=UPI0022FFE1F1|nr:2-thiouracil desulfurase family protein [Pseudomonas sp. Q1-7]
MSMPFDLPQRPRLGISACLLGNPVRYNGGHKESRLCSRDLALHVDFVPFCPEMAIGLGNPREPIRLVGDPAEPRAVGLRTSRDHTEALAGFGALMATQLGDIDGCIFMQKSPSCGLDRVRVYMDDGRGASAQGRGVFAGAFRALRPDLPVEEEGRLNDAVLRENFLTRVYAHARWRALCREGLSHQGIIAFHACYKYQLMAHDPVQYRTLGRLLGGIGEYPPEEVGPRYFSALMTALRKCATRGTHSNVLQHLGGYLKNHLDSGEKAELQRLIEQYRDGIVPLVAPMTLLKHHFNGHPDRYIAQQAYLQPHPEELGLRNAI